MKLRDLRGLAVRGSLEIRFRISEARECIVDRDGVCRLTDAADVSDLNLEEQFAQAEEFVVDPETSRPRSIDRQRLAELIESA